MNSIDSVKLSNGKRLDFIVSADPPRGCMKYTYFTTDKSMVVQFFNDTSSLDYAQVEARLDRILHKYNPTISEQSGGAIGNTEQTAKYFRNRFCWPIDIVHHKKYGLGIVSPCYPDNFFFGEHSARVSGMNLKGKDKNSKWFTGKSRKFLRPEELGDFRSMLQICILLSRTIRRLHQAGLAHSDLSCKNVLIDPKTATCVVIDVDALVVPNVYPPEVMGTRGYIAPEVLATAILEPKYRKYPSIYTDLHSLAVLIYEYLLLRHPLLDGPKVYDCTSAERDDFLALGLQATFIENPTDTSNRPNDLNVTISDLGKPLEELFLKSFVDGLHKPNLRPTALEWERGLSTTWDMLHSCENPKCDKKYFIIKDVHNPVCPFCKRRVSKPIVKVDILMESQTIKDSWVSKGNLIVEDGTPIMKWHLLNRVFPDERADRTVMAYVRYRGGKYILVNNACNGMYSDKGNLIPTEHGVIVQNNTSIRIIHSDTNTKTILHFNIYQS